jgi:hypothetical protein
LKFGCSRRPKSSGLQKLARRSDDRCRAASEAKEGNPGFLSKRRPESMPSQDAPIRNQAPNAKRHRQSSCSPHIEEEVTPTSATDLRRTLATQWFSRLSSNNTCASIHKLHELKRWFIDHTRRWRRWFPLAFSATSTSYANQRC